MENCLFLFSRMESSAKCWFFLRQHILKRQKVALHRHRHRHRQRHAIDTAAPDVYSPDHLVSVRRDQSSASRLVRKVQLLTGPFYLLRS